MKLQIFILAGFLIGVAPVLAADELKEPYKEIPSQQSSPFENQDDDDDDGLFSGIRVQDGNTTIRSGTLIGMDSAALHGTGKIPREVLPYLTRSVVYASGGDASVSTSESHSSSVAGISSSGLSIGANSSTSESSTNIPAGVSLSSYEIDRTAGKG